MPGGARHQRIATTQRVCFRATPRQTSVIAKRCLTPWGLAVRLLASSFDGDFGVPFGSTLTVLLTVRLTTLFAVLRSLWQTLLFRLPDVK